MKKYFVLALILNFSVSYLIATEFHVGPVGSGQPYSIIQLAINDADDGDIITVHEGEYIENLEIENISLTLRNSNWESVTGNFYPEDFTIDGDFTLGDDVINIYNCESVTIQGFSIINNGDWSDDRGIDAEDINNFEIRDCIFDNYRCSIDVWDCNNVIIENNIAYYNGDSGNKIINCFFLSNFRISNNLFYGIIGSSIGIKLKNSYNVFNEFSHVIDFEYGLNDNENIVVKCNEFNYSGSFSSNASIYTNGATNLTISENIFHYNPVADQGVSIQIWGGTNPGNYVKIENNIFKNNYRSIQLITSSENCAIVDVINNTFIGYNGVTVNEEVIHLYGFNQLNLFRNNIIYNALNDFYVSANYNTTHLTPTISYNSLGEDILTQYPTWSGGSNQINEDPWFVDPANSNFELTWIDEENHSPCIDAADPDTNSNEVNWQYDEDDRDIDGSRKDMGCYPYLHDYDTKVFTKGVHWISFPVLTPDDTYLSPPNPSIPPINNQLYQQAYEVNNTAGLLQDETGAGTIDEFIEILGNRYGTPMKIKPVLTNYVDFDENFENMLFRHEGYKIDIGSTTDPTELIVGAEEGDERLPINYEISGSMVANEYHWIGYWIPRTQNMKVAFGDGTQNDFWQHVVKVKSEDWFYSPAIIQRGEDPNPNYPIAVSAENLTLEYGKAYLVLFDAQIEDFQWTDSRITVEAKKKSEPESFTYTEKPDYKAIDVFNIPPNVTEIGVFEDDVCVGAVVVEDTCAQILVYSDNANRDPIPFTFEVVTGRGLSTPIKNYQVLNLQTGEFETKSIFSSRQEYSVMRFSDEEELEDNILSTPQLHRNYPNLFNPSGAGRSPTTTISFSLPDEQGIELSIYNIKGQKVKQLINGQLTTGQHSMTWDGKDTNGKLVSTGIYFYRLKTGEKEMSRKMLLLK